MEGQERIEDSKKAEEVAYSAKDKRDSAAFYRNELDNYEWSEDKKTELEAKANFWDEQADQTEEKAAIYFDINEQAKKLNEDELEAEVKTANIRQRETYKHLREAKQAASQNPSEFMIEEVEKADKEAIRAAREFGAWQAAQRNRRNSK
jgi:hypothetical protein